MFVLPLGTADAATSLSKTSLWELLSPPCNNGPPSILVKTMDSNESYGNTMVITAQPLFGFGKVRVSNKTLLGGNKTLPLHRLSTVGIV